MTKPRQYNQVDDPQGFQVTDYYDWKPSPRPVPVPGICDQPCKCIKINVEWLDVIIPALLRVGHSDIWQGTESETNRAHDEVNNLIGMLMACDCGTGTPNPSTPTVTIDYDLNEIKAEQDDAIGRYITYDPDDPQSVDIIVDPPTTPNNANLENALCGIMLFMTSLFREIWHRTTTTFDQDTNTLTEDLNNASDFIEAFALIVGTPAAALTGGASAPAFFALEAGALATREVADFLENNQEVEYNQDLGQAWAENLACYLFQNLVGQTITLQKWRSVAANRGNVNIFFQQAAGTPSKAEAPLRAWIAWAMQVSTYYTMLETVAHTAAASNLMGTDFDCPCCNIANTVLQTLKTFPAPDNASNPIWPEYPGLNPFITVENLYQASTFAHHSTFPTGRIVMVFNPPIRITNDLRLRIIHQDGAAAVHTLKVKTHCDEATFTLNVGAGGGSTNEDFNVSLPWLSQSTAERVNRIEFEYSASNNQPLILAYMQTRALLA
jgi:hypothetical protein